MFQLLQVVLTFFAVVMVVFHYLKHKNLRKYMPKYVAIVIVSSLFSGVLMEKIPLPTDTIKITALKQKNENSSNYDITINNFISSGKEGMINFASGIWIKNDDNVNWNTNLDISIEEWYTRAIEMKLPIGLDRSINFKTSEDSGKVNVTFDGKTETYDLYSTKEGINKIEIDDSSRTELYYIKALRFFAWSVISLVLGLLFTWLINYAIPEKKLKISGGGIITACLQCLPI